MDSDDDDCRRFVVNAVTERHTSTMSQEIDVPVLSLDDDNDDLMIDKDYKLLLDSLSDDNTLLPPFEDDNGESETRMFSSDANRSKRKIDELESPRAANMSDESTENDETLWDVPLYRTLEVIKRDNKARKLSESMVDDNTSWDVPLIRAQEAIQRGNKARKVSESDILWDVPLVKAQEVIQRGNKASRRFVESKVDTLRDVPLVRTKQVIQRDNKMSERRKSVTKAAETKRFVPVTQRNNGVCVGTRKKNVEESVDKDYMSYLTWLVDSLKHPKTVPGKDLSAKGKVEVESCSDDDDVIEVSDTPFTDGDTTPFVVSKSKIVIDLEKDDSTDDESGDSSSSVFRKELMKVLEKPFDEGELLLLSSQASMKKRVSRCRELRNGRERSYETSELGLSYLEKVSDFDKEYKSVDGDDKARLALLRGFFFYLKKISLPGAFKPWLPENRKKLGQR